MTRKSKWMIWGGKHAQMVNDKIKNQVIESRKQIKRGGRGVVDQPFYVTIL